MARITTNDRPEELPPEMLEIIDLLRKMPPVSKTVQNQMRCPKCGRVIHPSEVIIVRGGLKPVIEPLCPECYQEVKDMCPIICTTCGKVTMRIDPHKDPKTGFEFKRGRVYHSVIVDKKTHKMTPACAECAPGIDRITVAEHYMHILRTKPNKLWI